MVKKDNGINARVLIDTRIIYGSHEDYYKPIRNLHWIHWM